jgi:dihydrolipoamide dehydrogenase
MGTRVTIVELLDRILAHADADISHALTEELKLAGVRILTGHEVRSVEEGYVQAQHRGTGEVVDIPGRAVLMAIGRQPIIDTEAFTRLGIAHDARGIEVDERMCTSVPNIWAIGDATGKSILAHVGMQQGLVCAESIASGGESARQMDYGVIPAVVYSIPEVVTVGTVPDDDDVTSFKVAFSANLRARIEAYEEGFVKIWVRDGVVIAAQAIGYYVSELMQELSNMIALRTPVEDVADIIHAHPTYSEITRSVLEHALGRVTDFIPAQR